MLAIEFSKEIDGEYINQQLFEKGIVVGYKNNTLRILPALIIERNDIMKFVKVLSDLLST